MAFQFTDTNFQEKALSNDQLVIVDFWAEWCGPCRAIAPIIDELATEYEGKALVGKLDVDSNPEVSFKYSVNAIPTILFLKNGEEVGRHRGLATKQALKDKIETLQSVKA